MMHLIQTKINKVKKIIYFTLKEKKRKRKQEQIWRAKLQNLPSCFHQPSSSRIHTPSNPSSPFPLSSLLRLHQSPLFQF
ncbi:hypothetical protein QVD17_27649 [Tagetes erecta]|uniref:Uncharacterized protein n=1 Tax=Tagetes erecta TaxID=13708 RepID=A0AAD8NR98_TARER|nr:hypothetical protein QVD17_27649 [Tagetes erecta]